MATLLKRLLRKREFQIAHAYTPQARMQVVRQLSNQNADCMREGSRQKPDAAHGHKQQQILQAIEHERDS